MTESVNYDAAAVPASKAPEEFSYHERRAELLQVIRRAGHPGLINKTELAERYGVSPRTIRRDFDRITDYVGDNLTADHEFILDSVLRGSIQNLAAENKHYAAGQLAIQWSQWLADIGAIQKAPERVAMAAKVEHARDLSNEHYEVIPDGSADADTDGDADALAGAATIEVTDDR